MIKFDQVGIILFSMLFPLNAANSQSHEPPVRIEELVSFTDAFLCEPTTDFETFLQSGMILNDKNQINLSPPKISDKYKTSLGYTTFLIDTSEAATFIEATTAVDGKWHGLRMKEIKRDYWVPGVSGNFTITFSEPVGKVAPVLNALGFAVKVNSRRAYSDDLNYSIYTLYVELEQDKNDPLISHFSCSIG